MKFSPSLTGSSWRLMQVVKEKRIFRYIYNYLDCRKPFVRLWISSLTDRAIREGLDNLKPGSDYDNLYRAAEARAIADWEIGLNATQALSIAAGQGIFSLGRVQTPTLMMICSRYLENKDFTPQTYYQIRVTAAKDDMPFSALSEHKYEPLPAVNTALSCRNCNRYGYGCRRAVQGSQSRSAATVRPDKFTKRSQQQAWLFSGQDTQHRPVVIRSESIELPPHRLPLYLRRCFRRNPLPHRPSGTIPGISPPMPPP